MSPDVPPEWYKPYADNNRGVPDMATFGDGYRHHVTGLVHDENGYPTQNGQEVEKFLKRIHGKISKGFREIQVTKQHQMEDAEVFVIAYGSVARSALRAVRDARALGVKAGLLQLVTLFPFPRKIVDRYLRQCRVVIVPEMNMGQMGREIGRVNQAGCRIVKHNRIDGHLITPEEILKHLTAV